jgi:hypothetical protein
VLSTALRVAIPIVAFLFNTGLTVSGLVSLPLALISWALMIPVLLIALLWPRISPRLKRWTGAPDGTGLTDAQKRAALRDLLADALDEGHALRRTLYKEGGELKLTSKQDVEEWVDHTHDLIEASLGRLEAWRFLSNEGYTPEDLGWDFKPAPWTNWRDEKYLRSARMKRLDELINRVDSLDINADFDPQEWMGR